MSEPETQSRPDGYCEYHGGNDGCDCKKSKPPIWLPKTTKQLGSGQRKRAAINLVGVTGAGKSHCAVRQFALDPQYGPQEVLVAMVEDSTITYGVDGIGIEIVKTIQEVRDLISLLGKAAAAGKRLPKLFVLDDLSNLSQNERRRWERDPIMTKVKTDAQGNEIGEPAEDTRKMFRKKGYEMIDLMMDTRSDLPMDSITLVRSTEGGYMKSTKVGQETILEMVKTPPELALEGYIAPKHLTGHSSLTLYLKQEPSSPEPEEFFKAYERKSLFLPWRMVGLSEAEVAAAYERWKKDSATRVDTSMVTRFIYSQNMGEFQGKGHHSLRIKEKAYLPDIVRIIHGEKPLYLVAK